jgi:hypothetical protein
MYGRVYDRKARNLAANLAAISRPQARIAADARHRRNAMPQTVSYGYVTVTYQQLVLFGC